MISRSSAVTPRGLSPRVRGNHETQAYPGQIRGSIPARAGEPRLAILTFVRNKVYPRACGGTHSAHPPCSIRLGLSPRVRGNRLLDASATRLGRSIPARAGEPAGPDVRSARWTVYPRACGGTEDVYRAIRRSGGLSPRVRGNPNPLVDVLGRQGSIPARAGEPRNAGTPR